MTKRDLDLEKEWKDLKRKLEDKDILITHTLKGNRRSREGTSKESELEEEVEEDEEKISSVNFAKFIERAPSVEEKTVILDKVEEIQEQPNLEENINLFTESPKEEFNTQTRIPINEPKYLGEENKYVPAEFRFETSRAGVEIEVPENMRRMGFLNFMSLRPDLIPQRGGHPETIGPEEFEGNKKYFEKEY